MEVTWFVGLPLLCSESLGLPYVFGHTVLKGMKTQIGLSPACGAHPPRGFDDSHTVLKGMKTHIGLSPACRAYPPRGFDDSHTVLKSMKTQIGLSPACRAYPPRGFDDSYTVLVVISVCWHPRRGVTHTVSVGVVRN